MNSEMLAKSYGVTQEIVEKAFELSIESVLCKHLSVGTVIVDMDKKTVLVFFRVPFNMDYREALVFNDAILRADPLCVLFDLAAFPKPIVSQIRNVFSRVLMDMKDYYEYGTWRPKIHRIVEGLIVDGDDEIVEVNIDGQESTMPKSKWVPSESSLYRPGQLMRFCVDNVTAKPFKIFLSRTSLKFPALLLKHELPWHNFTCTKRYTGQKSFIFTDARLDQKFAEIRDKISAELNGEILEIRGFNKRA